MHARLSSLEEYTTEMERIAPQLAEYASRVESNFVARKVDRTPKECALWVPCREGRRRIDASMINKINAEGDYMRLYMDGSDCLVHDTIRHLMAQLDAEQFIQLHRSTVVRADFIDRLMHRERRWVARLRDGTEQAVAKSRVGAILRSLSADSSTGGSVSPTFGKPVEEVSTVNETEMKRLT
ncbi:LytTR family transcriptional regulator [Sphingomonas sp. BN140010]|uniref:LytTR family transcriptional regulator n=1 Tax=Sphingomonas arvum TaxID=2992113 RepID=A0ABT3JDX8_9SPHN|nr:LytTR family DNA-binding domain-containing protein [Sphingomonas sp. BN140010]MCW3797270.1 LytTR family transcriptional regulator [Sphingomonas sp. BN140010]